MIENERVKILLDFQIQTDKLVMANQPDVVVVDKHQRTAVVVDVAVPRDGNIRQKEHEKLEIPLLKEELEKMWSMKAAAVSIVIGALGAVTPNLDWWLQQTPTTSEISVLKSAVTVNWRPEVSKPWRCAVQRMRKGQSVLRNLEHSCF